MKRILAPCGHEDRMDLAHAPADRSRRPGHVPHRIRPTGPGACSDMMRLHHRGSKGAR